MADTKLPTGRAGRTVRLAGLAGHTVATRAQTRMHGRARGEAAEAAERARQERLAGRYAEVLGDMKGAVMKVGQILSFVDVDGVVPASSRQLFQSTLARLQADVPALAPDEIAAVIHAELGAPPEKIFAFFSPRPVAAASIGQVHLARLADGTELAVKVQYPGVADAVRADLANTDVLASVIKAGLALLGPEAPRLDPKMMVEEIRDRVGDELDYRIEAANQQEFHTLYDGHPFIHIPAVYPEFSTGRVLATDYVQAQRWSEATAATESLRSRWGETIFRFVFASLHRHGLFNADPHPGNYLFHRDGTVTFLDFGCVNRFTAERVSVMSALVDAALACDAPRRATGLHQRRAARRGQRRRAGPRPAARVLPRRPTGPLGHPTIHLHTRVGSADRGRHLPAIRTVLRHHPTAADAQRPSVSQPDHHRRQFHTRTPLRHRRLESDRRRDPPPRPARHQPGAPRSRLARPTRHHRPYGPNPHDQPRPSCGLLASRGETRSHPIAPVSILKCGRGAG